MKSSFVYSIINRVWIESMRSGYMNFQKALVNTEATQKSYLEELLKKNRNTEFGIHHNFKNISSVKEFQQNIPLSTYNDYEQYIEKISQGEKNVLTCDKVRLFEPSSGSTAPSKLIPYTNTLKKEFNRGIAPWMYSLYKSNPSLFKGKAYWSISPVMNKEKCKGDVKVGFEDDSDYLGFLGRWFYDKIAAVPSAVAKESDLNAFRNTTIAHLLLCENLALMSVWNPTFLTLLMDHLLRNKVQVLDTVKKLCGDTQLSRVNEIKNMLSDDSQQDVLQKVWPDLALISCWTDGVCKSYANQLYDYFPNIKIQGKGLIATEAFVSLPYDETHDPVLAINSHFFEFIDMSTGKICLAHELFSGKTYSVIVSTGGGLYRYQLEDVIEVTGFFETAPTFRFISKSNSTSDFMGEKINERHVNKCFEKLFMNLDISPKFFLLAPAKSNGGISYCLFLECDGLNDKLLGEILFQLEELLCNNFHYDYCRKLGQLNDLLLFKIKSEGKDAYLKQTMNDGVKAGDVKTLSLSKNFGWERYFEGFLYERGRAVL